MLTVQNVKIYDLIPSVLASGYAMRTSPFEKPLDSYTEDSEEFKQGLVRANKLVNASKNGNVHCHDNFMTGIRVSFDMKYTQYITKQMQRYHWFDYVSSSSLMHRITKMDFSKCCNKYVPQSIVDEMNMLISEYNQITDMPAENFAPMQIVLRNEVVQCNTKQDALYTKFMQVISTCPMGTELFVRVSTNYKQLQTMYWQRNHHKLKEDWGAFCKFVESLPYANELILGKSNEEQ